MRESSLSLQCLTNDIGALNNYLRLLTASVRPMSVVRCPAVANLPNYGSLASIMRPPIMYIHTTSLIRVRYIFHTVRYTSLSQALAQK